MVTVEVSICRNVQDMAITKNNVIMNYDSHDIDMNISWRNKGCDAEVCENIIVLFCGIHR